jgi:hypothetical protein
MPARALPLLAALLACASPASAHARLERPGSWGPYSVELVSEGGATLPTFQHRGRTYVLGSLGQRYLVRVRNGSPRRAEVVVSVDGRDVVDGQPSAWEKRGYLVEAYGEVTIDGYRLSEASVAAFRFSSVPRSYAARMGDARDVGVIGVAVFPERAPRPAPLALSDERAPGGRASPEAAKAAPEAESSGAAPSPSRDSSLARRESKRAQQRPGLGTEFAEEHDSAVVRVAFERASARPAAVLTLRYDDRQGLLALGIDVDGRRGEDAWARETAVPFRRNAYAEPPPGWRGR